MLAESPGYVHENTKIFKNKTYIDGFCIACRCLSEDSLNSEIQRVHSQCANPHQEIKGCLVCTVCIAPNIIYFIKKNNYQIYIPPYLPNKKKKPASGSRRFLYMMATSSFDRFSLQDLTINK